MNFDYNMFLNRDLESYIDYEINWIKHPLLFQPLFGQLNEKIEQEGAINYVKMYESILKKYKVNTFADFYNSLIDYKKKQVLEYQKNIDEKWGNIFMLLHTSTLLEYLYVTKDLFHLEKNYFEALSQAFTMNEFPTKNIENKKLRSLFLHFPNPRLMMDNEEKYKLSKFKKTIKIYRGLNINKGSKLNSVELGFSYTTKKNQAKWFANRWSTLSTKKYLIQAEISKENIICFLSSRGENEIVALPENLKNIKYTLLK